MNNYTYSFLKNVANSKNSKNTKKINNLQNLQHNQSNNSNNSKTLFDKDMNYYICSFGGSGSTVLFNYLSNFGNVFHIHDRFPPKKLKYIGTNNTTENIYSEWFNNIEVPDSELKKYKVIYIYRNPLKVIYSRFVQAHGANIPHLKNIMCENNGNIQLIDVLKNNKDLYKLEEFFDNYTTCHERNYKIYCVKYELFWDNISLFNKALSIPDIRELYPVKYEKPKKINYQQQLNIIYRPLLYKMHNMNFIKIV